MSLNFNEYQEKAKNTAKYPNIGTNIYYPTLGLAGESGEVAEKVKKLMRDHNGILDDEYRLKIVNEIGDVLWYCAMLSFELGYNLEDVATINLDKLALRKQQNKIHGSGDNR